MIKLKELYDSNAALSDVFPDLVATYPEKYQNQSLKDHCQAIHNCINNKRFYKEVKL
jgi:lysine decarboxylase/arginine decarboxylase